MSSRDSLHAKVRAILEKANHPTTPQAEAETALALAFRLMQKYDLDEDAVSGRQARDVSSHEVTSKVFVIKGPYRVRRGTLLWTIAKTLSCQSYRDMMESNPTEVIMVAYGTANDLFSLETLFQAAEMLALRTMPAGDRRFRTSWWIGYCEGISRKLEQENRVIVKEAPGVGLVLVERSERARAHMVASTPHLHAVSSSYSSDKEAYGAGHRAGSQFSAGRNGVGAQRQIGAGKRGK